MRTSGLTRWAGGGQYAIHALAGKYVDANNELGDALVGSKYSSYDAWGKVSVEDGDGVTLDASDYGNRYTFQGREQSWEIYAATGGTGLIYCRARWYDPITARWLSKDPIGISGGLNQYVFCRGNPVCYVDPCGLEADDQPHRDRGGELQFAEWASTKETFPRVETLIGLIEDRKGLLDWIRDNWAGKKGEAFFGTGLEYPNLIAAPRRGTVKRLGNDKIVFDMDRSFPRGGIIGLGHSHPPGALIEPSLADYDALKSTGVAVGFVVDPTHVWSYGWEDGKRVVFDRWKHYWRDQ